MTHTTLSAITVTRTTRGGYSLLLAVIIIGSVVSTILVSLMSMNTSGSKLGYMAQQSAQAIEVAAGCAEYAMLQLRNSSTYAGNEVRSIDTGSCTIHTVAGSGNTNRGVCVESTVGSATRRLEIDIAQILPTTKITTWHEVAAFSLCP